MGVTHHLYAGGVLLTPVVGFIQELVLGNCRWGLVNDSSREFMKMFEVCYDAIEQSFWLLEDRTHKWHWENMYVTWTGLITSLRKYRAEVEQIPVCCSQSGVYGSTVMVSSVCPALGQQTSLQCTVSFCCGQGKEGPFVSCVLAEWAVWEVSVDLPSL